jgi:hypothetical protein
VLQSLLAETSSAISQPINLSLQVSTANIFGPNDTLSLYFGQELLTASLKVTLTNGIVSAYNYDFASSREIIFSGFSILSSTFSRMTFTIILENGLTPMRSVKPI